jgi:photosystem II stability/assembly factor-like uncharacterized protein
MRRIRPTLPVVLWSTAFLSLSIAAPAPAWAPAPPPEDRLVQDLEWRNIGNANQRGRISAIDALEDDWTNLVVGTASGGVWKSTNAGQTWASIFDNYGSASIGDVTIYQRNPDIIWVGTGEEDGRNTAAWGDGVYKSTDGGETFRHMGLRDVYTIGSVVLHPDDPDQVWVTALGNIWSTELGRRGLFHSTDGGETWEKVTNGLPDDGRTGALYLVMDPSDPNTMYVSFWERQRTAYVMDSGGPNGGIFKSTDGGGSWQKLTSDLPEGPSGKIGLAISRSDPNVVMAHYEHGFQPDEDDPAYGDMSQLGSGIYRSEDGGETWEYVNRYWSRPFYYNHLAISPLDPELTYHFNQGLQYSTDGGRTLHPYENRGGGHCWHAIWLDPHNKNRFYTGSDGGVTLTHDAGENWVNHKNLNVTQYYRIEADLRDPYYVCGGLQDAGSSCGPSLSRADGIYLSDWYNLQGGDGTHVVIDPTDWRTVYTNRDPRGAGPEVLRSNVVTRENVDIRPNKGVNILNYEEYISPEIEAEQLAKGWGPAPEPGEDFNYRGAGSGAFRWNWLPPMRLSPHDAGTIYIGANHLFVSTDRGDTWRIISPDLTKNDPEKTKKASGGLTPDAFPGGGAEYYGTIVSSGASPLQPGVLWVGTDDGNVQLSRDGGRTWANVALNNSDLPSQELYVSRVLPSRFDEATAYVTYDGHESGNFQPWVFKTTDFGRTWTDITANLPGDEPVYAIEQDRMNVDLLFVGTEFGVYYTVDGGQHWQELDAGLPTVAVHDIMVHPREPDLIIGTHGRGIWILDHIQGLQQLTPEVRASSAHIFDNPLATLWLEIEPQYDGGAYAFKGENPSKSAVISYWLGSGGRVSFEITDEAGEVVRGCTVQGQPGVGVVEWDLRQGTGEGGCAADPSAMSFAERARLGDRVEPGSYRVRMTSGGETVTGSLHVRADPMLDTR